MLESKTSSRRQERVAFGWAHSVFQPHCERNRLNPGMMSQRNLRVVLLALAVTLLPAASPREVKTVAVIGSGIAGAASAKYLRELMPDADIAVFEMADEVGSSASVCTLLAREAFYRGVVSLDAASTHVAPHRWAGGPRT